MLQMRVLRREQRSCRSKGSDFSEWGTNDCKYFNCRVLIVKTSLSDYVLWATLVVVELMRDKEFEYIAVIVHSTVPCEARTKRGNVNNLELITN